MGVLDMDMQDKDVLLHLILKHCQQFVSKKIKILETKMYDDSQVNWDDMLLNPDSWRVYYISSFKTNWDVIVVFTPSTRLISRSRSGNFLRGGYKISEFIEGTFKPSYLI